MLEAGRRGSGALLGRLFLTIGGDFAGARLILDNGELVARHRHAGETQHLDRRRGTGDLHLLALVVDHRADLAAFRADDESVADLQRTLAHQNGGDGAATLVELRLDHIAFGGAITESDVTLAAASRAPLIGFNVRPNAKARQLAEREKISLRYYDVIYDLLEEVRGEMAGQLAPERIETIVGRAEVLQVFPAGKKDKAAGLLVLDGIIRKGLAARLTRDDVIVSRTNIASLRRFKDDVAEVRAGMECGAVLQDTNDIKPGDTLELFEVEERARTL